MTAYEAVLDALADRTRREILVVLRAGPTSVAALAERLPVSRPAVSQHLRVLRQSGLVLVEPAGTRQIHRLAPDGAAPLRVWLEEFWGGALGAFAAHADAVHEESR